MRAFLLLCHMHLIAIYLLTRATWSSGLCRLSPFWFTNASHCHLKKYIYIYIIDTKITTIAKTLLTCTDYPPLFCVGYSYSI